MSESPILSSEEVDALLQASQGNQDDLAALLGGGQETEQNKDASANINGIVESIRYELEKIFTAYFRKKIQIKTIQVNYTQLANLVTSDDVKVYSIFRVAPSNGDNALIFDLSLLNQAVNLLYGGHVNPEEKFNKVGKFGLLTATALAKICLEGLTLGCKEYGTITCDILKTTDLPNLIHHLNSDASVYNIAFNVKLDEVVASMELLLSASCITELLPENVAKNMQQSKVIWKNVIKDQVIDSQVMLSAQIAEVNMNIQDFMSLKSGDVISISDPTQIFLCLNNVKLFKAIAGQANSKRVAKIVSKV